MQFMWVEMRMDWLKVLKYDPITPLLESKSEAITYFTRRDLLDEDVEPLKTLWNLPSVRKILRKQQSDGSWKYSKNRPNFPTDYQLFQTIKTTRQLVVLFELNKAHLGIQNAAKFIFDYQSADGDIRRFYGHQYSPNYSSLAVETLIEAGFEEDPRISKFFQWLISIRLDDGGWAIPIRQAKVNFEDAMKLSEPIQPIKTKPASHWVTDLALRVFAAHSIYRKAEEAKQAANLLLFRLFKADKYPDRRNASYWTTFSYPFWWGDLLSTLNSISLIGFSKDHPEIKTALDWFIEHQQETGLWREKMLMFGNNPIAYSWHSLAICRVFKRFFTSG